MSVKLAIAQVRNQRSMTQDELAKQMNMSLKGIQYLEYEAKTVNLDVLERLCKVLNCEPGDLFKRESSRNDEALQRREEQRLQKSERMKRYWADKRAEKAATESVA